MAKNIAVSNSVYQQLSMLKRNNESFSDVIRRIIAQSASISDLANKQTFSQSEWNNVRKAFESQKEFDNQRKKQLLDQVK